MTLNPDVRKEAVEMAERIKGMMLADIGARLDPLDIAGVCRGVLLFDAEITRLESLLPPEPPSVQPDTNQQ